MSNLTIFEDQSNLPTVKRESRLADKIGSGGGLRRIGLSNGRTFKRIVGGEQVGKAVPQELNVIIVDMLKDVSREYYSSEYDPEGQATLPDCWSNDGRRPDPKASNAQASSCAECPMNVDGSGRKGKGKACRFKRRLAVLVEGDPTGEVYQLGVPAKSLFGKGEGNVHPFESYCNYLRANGEAPDTVVTKVMYDTETDTAKVYFKAVRHLTQQEADMVDVAFNNPDTQKYIQLTAAEADGATAKPVAAKQIEAPKQSVFDDDGEDTKAVQQPVKRTKKAAEEPVAPKKDLSDILDQWGDE